MSSENNQKQLPKYPKLSIIGLILLGGWIIWEGISNYGVIPHEAQGNRRRFLNQIIAEGMQKVYEIGGANAVLFIYLLLGGFFLFSAFRIFKQMRNDNNG